MNIWIMLLFISVIFIKKLWLSLVYISPQYFILSIRVVKINKKVLESITAVCFSDMHRLQETKQTTFCCVSFLKSITQKHTEWCHPPAVRNEHVDNSSHLFIKHYNHVKSHWCKPHLVSFTQSQVLNKLTVVHRQCNKTG